MSREQQVVPSIDHVLTFFELDVGEFGVDLANCQWRPVQTFPNGSSGELEDPDEEYFAEVIGPRVWAWAEQNSMDSQTVVLVIEARLSEAVIARLRELANYLGSTEAGHHYIGPVVPFQVTV